ncbi:hypothetical protein LJK87_44225 [Paenibacillus sp. P25]|nr:hypothetical protein LJK87_44225 [Paenibacillus sp. P25]
MAAFRATCTRFVGEQLLKELVDELTRHSPEFRDWWSRHDVSGTPAGRKVIRHPEAGTLIMEHLTFQVYDDPDLKSPLYRPLPEQDTVEKINKLLQQRKG